jgi:hypothetical protein
MEVEPVRDWTRFENDGYLVRGMGFKCSDFRYGELSSQGLSRI